MLDVKDRESLHAASAPASIVMLCDYMSHNSSDLKDLHQVVWKHTFQIMKTHLESRWKRAGNKSKWVFSLLKKAAMPNTRQSHLPANSGHREEHKNTFKLKDYFQNHRFEWYHIITKGVSLTP